MEKNSSNALEIIPISQSANDSIEYIEGRRKGTIKSLRTPWEKMNRVTLNGLEWRTITTIGGASGSGKTAILNQLETDLLKLNPHENFNVLSFNFEMLSRNLVSRKLSREVRITTQELHSGVYGEKLSDEAFQKVLEAKKKIENLRIFYVENPGTVDQIKMTIWKFIKDHPGEKLVVLLDHTILVKGKSGELERIILFELMSAFNALKKLLDISFIVLTQLNRSIEQTDRLTDPSQQFPRKGDIFGGDSVFQFSDVVMVSMNPEQLGLSTYGPKSYAVEGFLYWHFLKLREGQSCVARMINNLKHNVILDA